MRNVESHEPSTTKESTVKDNVEDNDTDEILFSLLFVPDMRGLILGEEMVCRMS